MTNPNDSLELVYKLIAVLVFFGGIIIWLIRLEQKVHYIDKDHAEHKLLVKENQNLMWGKIAEIQEDTKKVLLSLTRIEETLKNIKRGE